jgi:hypothetical protein
MADGMTDEQRDARRIAFEKYLEVMLETAADYAAAEYPEDVLAAMRFKSDLGSAMRTFTLLVHRYQRAERWVSIAEEQADKIRTLNSRSSITYIKE